MEQSTAEQPIDKKVGQPFEATIDAEVLKTTIKLIDTLFDECHVFLDEDAIRLSAIEPATVASANLTLKSTAFDSYTANSDHLGIDMGRFRDVVGMANRGEQVHLALDTKSRKLEIQISGLNYTLALIDPESMRSPPELSSDEFEVLGEVTTTSEDFDRAVKAADMVSNHLALGTDKSEGVFYVQAEGDTDDVSLALSKDELVDFKPEDTHSLFSLDYMTEVCRAMPAGLEVDFQLGTEQPIAIEYEFAEGAGSVTYLLAPRISSR